MDNVWIIPQDLPITYIYERVVSLSTEIAIWTWFSSFRRTWRALKNTGFFYFLQEGQNLNLAYCSVLEKFILTYSYQLNLYQPKW